MVELLAPAGNMQSFLAALKSGADAMYLGLQNFGARASAGNFSLDELKEVRRLSALHGKKIYVTMNTLVKQKEISELCELIRRLGDCAPDAVIVQDIGVARCIRQILPDMEIHASTQMGIHSAGGAKFLREQGFSRVVLARECSLDTIREVAATGIEVEVFVHGALCVAMSGQCLLSSFHGGRSGNRGRCAQPCRQKLHFAKEKGAWLSTRDIMLYDQIPTLIEAGVHSFKIEGRLKSPSYVAHVCAQYRKGIDSYAKQAFQKLSKEDYIAMLQSFNRGDFSQGYAGASEDAGIINAARSNHQGVRIGTLQSIAKTLLHIRLDVDLHNGDMLRVVDGSQEKDFELIYSGPNKAKGEIASTFYRGNAALKPGLEVWRLISEAQAENERNLPNKRKEVDVEIRLLQGQSAQVCLHSIDFSHSIRGEVCEAASKAPLSADRIEEAFRKTAEQALLVKKVQVETDGVFMPISKLNALRRNAMDAFVEAYFAKTIRQQTPQELKHNDVAYRNTDKHIVVSPDPALHAHLAEDEIFVYAPIDNRKESLTENIAKLQPEAYVLLNTSISDSTAQHIITLCREQGLRGVVLDNIAQLGLDWQGLCIAFGSHIPIMNRMALAVLAAYEPEFIMAFPELSAQEMQDLQSKLSFLYYGRERMMILNHCPARTALGLQKNKEQCRMCHEGNPKALLGKEFIDRKEMAFPLLPIFTDHTCIVEMYNAVPTNLSLLPQLRMQSIITWFTTEPLTEQIVLLDALRRGKTLEGGTLGHYQDPVV